MATQPESRFFELWIKYLRKSTLYRELCEALGGKDAELPPELRHDYLFRHPLFDTYARFGDVFSDTDDVCLERALRYNDRPVWNYFAPRNAGEASLFRQHAMLRKQMLMAAVEEDVARHRVVPWGPEEQGGSYDEVNWAQGRMLDEVVDCLEAEFDNNSTMASKTAGPDFLPSHLVVALAIDLHGDGSLEEVMRQFRSYLEPWFNEKGQLRALYEKKVSARPIYEKSHLDALDRYLVVYEEKGLIGRPWREVAEAMGKEWRGSRDDQTPGQTLQTLKEVTTQLQDDLRKAKVILENVDRGVFPGVYDKTALARRRKVTDPAASAETMRETDPGAACRLYRQAASIDPDTTAMRKTVDDFVRLLGLNGANAQEEAPHGRGGGGKRQS